ncbi:MAG: prenyltransferase/squalene oxidase repeat-containing protein [Fimbriiglobus sp.]
MKWLATLLLALAATMAPAQDKKAETIKYILALQDPETGAFKVIADAKPSVRACNGGVKLLKVLGEKIPQEAKLTEFVKSRFNADEGQFQELDGTSDLATTAVGVMVVAELTIDKKPFAPAMFNLQKRVKTFEEARIAAASAEAWGISDPLFSYDPWFAIAAKEYESQKGIDAKEGGARLTASYMAMLLRLKRTFEKLPEMRQAILTGQKDDGGWGKAGAKTSDLETCYRVLRALKLDKTDKAVAVKLSPALTKFIDSCRNADGGYSVEPSQSSTLSGTYYAVMVETFLAELTK